MGVSNAKHQYNVLIAVDPLEPEFMPTEVSLQWVKSFIKDKEATVDVVYVSSEQANLKLITETEFMDYVMTLELGKDVKAKILFESSSSRRKSVNALIEYAKERNSDLVVVSSHGRSSIGRLVMGSFSESLLAISPVPVLFLNLKSDLKKSNKVLFPTDLSKFSKNTLELFLDQLGSYQGEFILYHAILTSQYAFTDGVYGSPVFMPESYWEEQKLWIEKECDALLKEIRGRGFLARVVIQEEVRSISSAIQKFAQDEQVDLIGMASLSKGFDANVMGSVARELFRLRKWPVWVCGPEIGGKSWLSLPIAS